MGFKQYLLLISLFCLLYIRHLFGYICLKDLSLQVWIENLDSKQTESEIEIRGPPSTKAFDHEGNPTKVLASLLSSALKFLYHEQFIY